MINLVVEVEQKGKPLMLLDNLTDVESITTMASQNSFFTSSPTVVLPPNPPERYFASSHYANATSASQPPNGFGAPFTPNASIPPMPGSLAGRKRSRGDAHAPEEEEEGLGDGSVETPLTEAPAKPRGKPMYGSGMMLIYPEDPGYTAAAESQSGTWVEERAECSQFPVSHRKRPSISARKSQRKVDPTSCQDHLAQLVLPPQMRDVTDEPLIDEATRVLGISWTRMDSTEALSIGQAAYAKWIQNHYPALKDVTVWLENSAISGYLAEARNAYSSQKEYYIFSHDLTEARMVTSEPSQLMPRLRMLPALELAAPGGCIKAEIDPITAARNEVNGIQTAMANGEVNGVQTSMVDRDDSTGRNQNQDFAYPTSPIDDLSVPGFSMGAFCSAHAMELD